MATKAEDEKYCHGTWSEGNRFDHRRIHEIHVVGTDGKRRVIKGAALPSEVHFLSGKSTEGYHVLEVLANEWPKELPKRPLYDDRWPSGRDVMHVVIGMVIIAFVASSALVVTRARDLISDRLEDVERRISSFRTYR